VASTQNQWLGQVGRVLETLNQGAIISNDERRIVFANSMFLEMIKRPAEDVSGRLVTDFYPPEEINRLQEFIARREEQDALDTNSTYRRPMAGDCQSLSHPAWCPATTAERMGLLPLPTYCK
jgi:PAS domain-containing protein